MFILISQSRWRPISSPYNFCFLAIGRPQKGPAPHQNFLPNWALTDGFCLNHFFFFKICKIISQPQHSPRLPVSPGRWFHYHNQELFSFLPLTCLFIISMDSCIPLYVFQKLKIDYLCWHGASPFLCPLAPFFKLLAIHSKKKKMVFIGYIHTYACVSWTFPQILLLRDARWSFSVLFYLAF